MQQEHTPLPDLGRIRELLSYCPTSGDLTWIAKRKGVTLGSIAGTISSKGYRVVRVDGTLYKAHRIAYLINHGIDPAGFSVDHINGDTLDNSIANLRLATPVTQSRNCSQHSNNTSGTTGVWLEQYEGAGRWVARWKDGSKYRNKGFSIRKHGHDTAKELAIAARAEALAALDHYTSRHGVAA